MSVDEKLCTCFAGRCERHIRLPDGRWKKYIPNPLHPLLPPLPERKPMHPIEFERENLLRRLFGQELLQMASDGQVEEKPASGPPRPIETMREWPEKHADGCECWSCKPEEWK